MRRYDKIIIGGGIYGLYAALFCAKRGEAVIVLEYDPELASRATYVNQARIHNGYHYPRSYSTAKKSERYFERFCNDFSFAINKRFEKIYAISKAYSWTSAKQFRRFCEYIGIKCEEIHPSKYFNEVMIAGAFLTEEYAFDGFLIKEYFMDMLRRYPNVEIVLNARISEIKVKDGTYQLKLDSGYVVSSPYVLNTTYASVNQIVDKFCFERFRIKYELCEIIIVQPGDKLADVGITVMDGPFFSIMPFGLTNYHSLTSVEFTPHKTSFEFLPEFHCQSGVLCSPEQLANCNSCPNRPKTAYNYMRSLAKKYLKEDLEFKYEKSLFSIKPILLTSEIDDSRPTLIKQFSKNPTFISVLSGKINTIYDLEEVL